MELMMDIKDAKRIIKDLSETTFICSEHCIETESGYVITTKEKRKYARNKKQTNADRIRNMSDEELAVIIMCPYDNLPGECTCEEDDSRANCIKCCLEWLQAEVKDEGE